MTESRLLKGLDELNQLLDGHDPGFETQVETIDLSPKYDATAIKQLRKKLNLTQVEFAKVMAVSPKTVTSWETGRNTPRGAVSKLMDIFNDNPKLAFEYAD
ncbi:MULTISPECIES: DNA-binding transcriptional regulator [unclassified Lactobacillus]|uniref:helix-turn-helix domain-containing protein n=1 Tax=unclassified Lactobacillus TaxID=2620435 RepID=UPI000EFD8B4B|nr:MULTISPECIES: helix-turn-helix domain-containing protein [unclassified Lactobacillus]RMC38125.1 helix-turn-helix domain-containing protein [Lactobacillus sp. ESL0237]RMC42664.1 helix-turn-helix domain-containing protein [Lactobacillus sp. ESL0234]RMC43353.1 helix-turn-helix domain-containing protein [Lactobacillus sp. ESL0236]RMC47877.1 helix-turn-helix domain-containing protein [Lactobacillus sp. ESL0225]